MIGEQHWSNTIGSPHGHIVVVESGIFAECASRLVSMWSMMRGMSRHATVGAIVALLLTLTAPVRSNAAAVDVVERSHPVAVQSALARQASAGSALTPAGTPIVRPDEGRVIRLYQAVLDRQPDLGGFAFWVERLQTGWTLDRTAAGFVESREFGLVYGTPDDETFVELLYSNVLDRQPDELGQQFWVDRLAEGMSRTRVVVLFSESPEFISITGTGLADLGDFEATVNTVSAAELGSSWRSGCPVGPENLRRVEATHLGFDGLVHSGSLIVHEVVAGDTVSILEQLWDARYPIESMVPVDQFGSDDLASMDANNTSAFNCRAVTGGSNWSNHAFGRAIDINPGQNPYVTSSQVLPPNGVGFVDRSVFHPAMIRDGDVVVEAFTSFGWRWGGNFNSIKDWHHFDL